MTCALIITTILNPHFNKKPSKLCGDLNKSISKFSKSVVFTVTHVEDCKLVLEYISSSRDTVKLKMLNTSQENTHRTSSFNENILSKKVNGGKTNTAYVMSKESDKIVDFGNVQQIYS